MRLSQPNKTGVTGIWRISNRNSRSYQKLFIDGNLKFEYPVRLPALDGTKR